MEEKGKKINQHPFHVCSRSAKIYEWIFDSATTKSTADFSSESPSGLTTNCVDGYEIKRSQKKLEIMKEIHSFAKENGNEERAKAKIKTIESVEDQLEACCDDELKCFVVSWIKGLFLVLMLSNVPDSF